MTSPAVATIAELLLSAGCAAVGWGVAWLLTIAWEHVGEPRPNWPLLRAWLARPFHHFRPRARQGG